MEAGKRTLNDIFNGNRLLEVPFFQRAYVWEESQWKRLLEDMEGISALPETHFMGSVILKQQQTTTGNGNGDVRTLVDGQQRLTTLNIFFKVLWLKQNAIDSSDRSINRIDSMFRLFNDNIALKHNHNDIEAFNRIMDLNTLENLNGDDNVTRSYNFFKENLDSSKISFQELLNNITFVGIDLTYDEDEQQIFDTINSLGVKLTTAELLKNYLFDRNDISLYDTNWKQVFESDEETKDYWYGDVTIGRTKRSCIDLFFYSFLQIKVQENSSKIKSEDKVQFSRVDKLFESYKKFIKEYYNNNKNSLIDEIKDYAILFRNSFKPEITDRSLTDEYGIDRINLLIFGLETSTLISYILYIEKNVKDKGTKNDLYESIESFIMRRMVSKATTKNYNQLFTERLIHNKVLSKKDFVQYIEKQSDKVNYWPSDKELKEAFNRSKLTNKQAAGILYMIESRIRNIKNSTQLLGFNKYSLEHIMPKKWENNWNIPKANYTKEDRNNLLLTLGNLTIITQSLNSSLRDSEWTKKLYGKDKKSGLIQYSNGIETVSQYLNFSDWNEDTIKQRARDLSEKAVDVWEK